jgi:CheY-like chemotaxis protein
MNTDFLKGKRLLIAEDDFVNQKLITHSLQSTGAHFDIAGNGQEAVDMLRQGQYDLVLMDINMPEMDGFEATQIIRKEVNATIPIIAMTGWSSRTEGDKFTQVGMNGCLAKPFGLDALFKTLDEIFQHNPVVAPSTDKTVLGVSEVETPQVDLNMLHELAEGDIDYKTTIVNMFLESMPESIQKMEGFLAEKNWDGLYKAAHYAKSSLSVVKVPEMHALAGAMEGYAKKGENLEALPDALELFKRYFTQVQEQLAAEVATWKP